MPAALSSDEERLKRFLREAKSAARLHHTNVAAVHQAGAEGRLAYIAMEYVEGTSLDKAVSENKPMAWREATRVIRDAAAGLGAAHAIGLVHRDIKPANLIRTKDGVTKVVDFGLARGQQTNTQLTQQGTLLGTPAYMAPEQWTRRRGRRAERLVLADLHVLFPADRSPAVRRPVAAGVGLSAPLRSLSGPAQARA